MTLEMMTHTLPTDQLNERLHEIARKQMMISRSRLQPYKRHMESDKLITERRMIMDELGRRQGNGQNS